jgi:hypothetical protein
MKLVLPPNWAQPFAASGAAVPPPDAGVKAKDFMLIVFALFGKANRLSFSECIEGDVKKELTKLATRHGLGTIWMVLSDIPYFQDIVKLPEFQEFNDPESSKFRSLTRNPCWTTAKKETARTIRVEWLEPNKEFPWIYGLLTTLNKEGLQGVLRGSVSASDAEQAAALLRPNTPAQIRTTPPRPRPPRSTAARASAPPSYHNLFQLEVIINGLKDKLKICEEMRDKANRAYQIIDETMKNADGSLSEQAEEYRTVLDQKYSDFVRAAGQSSWGCTVPHGQSGFQQDL